MKTIYLNKKTIIFLVASIILLKVVPQFLSHHLANRLTKIFKKKYHFFFRIENPRLQGMKKFVFNAIYIKTDKYRIILRNGLITINLRGLRHKGSFYEIIQIFDLQEVFFLAISLKSKWDVQQNKGNNDQFSFEERYYSIFRRNMGKFWRMNFRGNIERMVIMGRFHNKTVSFFFKGLDMLENYIKGYAEINIRKYWLKTPFELHKDADDFKIEISNQKSRQNLGTASFRDNQFFSFSEYKITYKEIDSFNYTFLAEVTDVLISSKNILPNPVLIKKIDSEQLILFTPNEFRILKESSLSFDGILTFMEFHHYSPESDLLRMSVIFFLDGNDFLQRFPFLSVQGLRSLEVSGDTAVKLDYMTSLNDFSSYYFNAEVLQNTLKVEKSKEFDISFLTGDFVHSIKDYSGKVREINISQANKKFLSINEIPFYLRNIIVMTEDPNFYKHNGIDGYFFGIAIAKNIINKKFVKGASTITMQLAKNLFLTKLKSPVRKFEEIVLAWLMENSFKLSKNRILEIYLNIIEFGENIYGLAEAAQYYFEKNVAELDITESLVLSYIIPRPKYFLEAVLMKSPKLILNLTRHMDFYSNDLLSRKLIDKKLYDEIKYDIKFKPSIGILVLKKSLYFDKCIR